MKRLFILMFVLVFVFLNSTTVFAEEEKTDAPKAAAAAADSVADVNVPVDPNTSSDPNVLKEHFPEVLKAVEKIGKKGKKEIGAWRRLKAEGSSELFISAIEQATAELNLIKKYAAEEGAVKTKAAIELLLADRAERFSKIAKRLEREEERLKKTRARPDRTRRRPSRD